MIETTSTRKLLAQTQIADQALVSCSIRACEVLEQARPATNHLEQSATGGVVLDVAFEVLGEFQNATGEQRDLHVRRTGVLLVHTVTLNDPGLGLCGHRHFRCAVLPRPPLSGER